MNAFSQKSRGTAVQLMRSLATARTSNTTSRTRLSVQFYSSHSKLSRKPAVAVASATRPSLTTTAVARRQPLLPLQQRSISFWNIPLTLMTASPLKKRLTLAALGGAGVAVAVVLGPFLLVGLGGIAAAIAFRIWRIKRDIQSQLKQSGQPLQDWPDFLNAFMQQQGMGGIFGKEQHQVEAEALRRLEFWAQSERGRDLLIEHGIHPERVTQEVSIRGSSYSSTSSSISGTTTDIKLELDLKNSPGTIMIVSAQLDKESSNLTIHDMKLVDAGGRVLHIPLSVNQQNRSGGRVIEGEFHDV